MELSGVPTGLPFARRSVLGGLPISIILAALACTESWAQKDTGAIAGTVKDSSGAVVTGAKVTITDVDRGTGLTTDSSAQGEYVVSPLQIGRYKVTVEKPGFKKAVAGPVTVDVQARPEVNFTMQVGSFNETVTVSTEGPQLETETSDPRFIQFALKFYF